MPAANGRSKKGTATALVGAKANHSAIRSSQSRADAATDDESNADDPLTVETVDTAILTQGLRKEYPGGLVAVEHLDFAVRPGEIFGLLGPNGAGKTTTVGMLTTRIKPTAGTALVNGIDVVAQPALAKRTLGVVAQGNNLDRSLNVWQNLYFHGRYFGFGVKAAKAAADEWLEAFRLTSKAKVNVEALSGGMARRLMLARAMLHHPAVVFLDEPTAALDPQSRLALWEVISQLRARGQTILLTTHYLEEADQFCDRIAVMDHGGILALDTPKELKNSLGNGALVTIRTEGDLETLATHLRRLDGATSAWPISDGVRVHFASTDGTFRRVLTTAESAGFSVTDLSVSEETLETVFISLTGSALRE